MVYLVGAGPGDAGLLTLRGAECLARADVVLYDYLVNPRILDHAASSAERICLGQHGRSRIWSQEEVNARMVADALAGRTVVRLKGGDPAIFARGIDEISALVEAGIQFQIIPGVTTALAAASYAGIPLTHRDHASAVALLTGREDNEKAASNLDYSAVAAFPGTLVFYMGVTTARQWSRSLIEAGKPPQTPVAIVRRCTLPDQRIYRCELAEVANLIEGPPKIRPPAIVIVGEVARLGKTSNWFEQRPLVGQRVMVTRPTHQAAALIRQLEELGAETILQPTIQISPPREWTHPDMCLRDLRDFDWLVFSSANGVHFFIERLLQTGSDLRALGQIRIASIGPGTSDELAKFHLRADVEPDEFRAESLAAALAHEAKAKRFLLVRASRGRDVLRQQLTAAGAIVTESVFYQSSDIEATDPSVAAALNAGQVDWITVTSSSIARNLVRLFGENIRRAKLVSISPVTSQALRELGFEPSAEATEYTMAGVVEAIREFKERP